MNSNIYNYCSSNGAFVVKNKLQEPALHNYYIGSVETYNVDECTITVKNAQNIEAKADFENVVVGTYTIEIIHGNYSATLIVNII